MYSFISCRRASDHFNLIVTESLKIAQNEAKTSPMINDWKMSIKSMSILYFTSIRSFQPLTDPIYNHISSVIRN